MARGLALRARPRRRLVFLDASVLVAASRSPSGGSAVVMEVCRGRRFWAALTTRVLLEARVNIAEKFGEMELIRFYQQAAALDPQIVPPPLQKRIDECVPLVGEKDSHVLAAALECHASYLITLDRRHLLTSLIRSSSLPLKVITPGEFLHEVAKGVAQ